MIDGKGDLEGVSSRVSSGERTAEELVPFSTSFEGCEYEGPVCEFGDILYLFNSVSNYLLGLQLRIVAKMETKTENSIDNPGD